MKEIDITKSILVPKHILMKEDEVKDLLAKYNISSNQLPKISRKDPAIAGIGVKAGDVIKIIRQSQTAGKSFYYRMVVNE